MGVRTFIETKQYRKFAEFCDECRDSRYIGICHGPPGVGKTLSARRYALWDEIEALPPYAHADTVVTDRVLTAECAFYTPNVLNGPGQVDREISQVRGRLKALSLTSKEVTEEMEVLLESARREERKSREEFMSGKDYGTGTFWDLPRLQSKVPKLVKERYDRHGLIKDPTRLVIVDEADRLKMPALEQIRHIFDQGSIGVVLIGMPGLEKRLSRYPQLYSRVGFVHAFTPLSQDEMSELFRDKAHSEELGLPDGALDDREALAAIIRATGGNFRLLQRLLAQVQRLMEINSLRAADTEIVEAARQALVIGTD